jgi:hypothetical protein
MSVSECITPDIKRMASRICRNEHLESIYLDYLRFCATKKSMKKMIQSEEILESIDTLIETSLSLFLHEACKMLPIEQLNGEKKAFLEEVTRNINDKYRLHHYF